MGSALFELLRDFLKIAALLFSNCCSTFFEKPCIFADRYKLLTLFTMKKKQGFTLRSVAGEQVLVPEGLANIDFSRIISFNDTAAFLWQRLGNDEFDVILLLF